MRFIILVSALAIATSCVAQTPSNKPVKSHALTKCESDLKSVGQANDAIVQIANEETARLQARIKELEAKNEELRTAAREYIKTDDELHLAYENRLAKLTSDLAGALTVLNMTSNTTQAVNQSTMATNELVRQQKISNAIALANLMKPIQPVQVQMPTIQFPQVQPAILNPQINCTTSATSPQSTWTTCQ